MPRMRDIRLFILYLVVKPVCGSLMLVGMFFAADQAAKAGAVPAIGRAGIAPEFPVASAAGTVAAADHHRT